MSSVSLAKKSMLAALVMLVAYHFLYPHLSHRFYKLGGQERANYVRAQQYVYEVPSGTNVILGSSLSAELDESILGPDYFKLTFHGKSTLTALEIVRRGRKRPKVVLIETNTASQGADSELLHDLFSPWLSELRRYSPVFKGEGRPANFLVGMADTAVSKGIFWSERILPGTKIASTQSPPSKGLPSSLFSQVLSLYHKQYETVAPETAMTESINRLGEYVDALSEDGSICVFFEMPIDASLAPLARPTYLRELTRKRFPPGKYHWISFAQHHNYKTKDGVHLTEDDARKVTEQLVEKVNAIIHKVDDETHRN